MTKSVDIPTEWLPLFEWHEKWHYKKQLDMIDATANYWEVVFCAGNGTGKTHMLYWNIDAYCLGIHPYQFAPPPLKWKVLLTDFEHGYGKIFTETCLEKQYMPDGTVIDPMISDKFVKKYPSRDDRTLEFTNGSLIMFQTSEQRKRLHSGTNFDGLGCDEEPDYQAYDESKRGLRTAKGGGKILHSFTPPFDEESKNRGPTWTKFHLIDPFEKGTDTDICVIKAKMADNPAITEEFIRKFSKGKTEEQLRIQLYGEYPTWGRLILPEFQDDFWDPVAKIGHLLPDSFEVPWNDPDTFFEMSIDWHGSKPPAIVWTFEYLAGPNKGDVVVFDELSPEAGRDMTITEAKTAIREVEGWSNRQMKRYGDPKMKDKSNALISGFNAWDEFRHGNPKMRLVEGWNKDPYVGYSVMRDFLRGKGRQFIEHPRLFIKENCRTLRHNMKNHYNVLQSNGTSKPDAKFNDYCVSLKYILQNKSRKIKKNMMGSGKYSKLPLTSNGSCVGVYDGTYINPGEYKKTYDISYMIENRGR